MQRILFAVLCVMAVVDGQSRGSKRFTPSPFLLGEDLGFRPSRRTTPQPRWSAPAGRPSGRRRPAAPTRLPVLGENDIDSEFGTVSPVRPATEAAVRPAQKLRTEGRRRRPARVQAVSVQVPEEAGSESATTAATTATASPEKRQPAAGRRTHARPFRRRPKASRRVKKIKKIIHPGDEVQGAADVAGSKIEDNNFEVKRLVKSDFKAEQANSSAGSVQSPSTTQAPEVLRRKKIFRGFGGNRQFAGKGRGSSRRQFASRRRVVTPVPPTTTVATVVEPTDAPLVVLSTSSPFEPFPPEENEVEGGNGVPSSLPNFQGQEGIIGAGDPNFTFTRVPASSGSQSDGTSPSAPQPTTGSSSGVVRPGEGDQSTADDAVDGGGSSASPPARDFSRRRPAARGSTRGRGQGVVSADSSGARRRGSGRRTQASGAAGAEQPSRRQFARRRRPSAEANAVTHRAPTTTTATTAATTTTRLIVIDSGDGVSSVQTFGPGGFTFTSSLAGGAGRASQTRIPSSFEFGPPAQDASSTPASGATFGAFRPVTPPASFGFGSAATARPASASAFPATFRPNFTSRPTTFFGSSSTSQGSGQSTPSSATATTSGSLDFGFSTSTPHAFFNTDSRSPAFGSFAFGTDFENGGTSDGGTTFSSISSTARPALRFTSPSLSTNSFGFGNPPTTSLPSGFGSISSSSGSFSSNSIGTNSLSSSTRGFGPATLTSRSPDSSSETRSSGSSPSSSNFTFSSFSSGSPASTFSTDGQAAGNFRFTPSGGFSFGTGQGTALTPGPATLKPAVAASTTPHSTFPTANSFTSAFGMRAPTSAPAILTEASRFFGSGAGSVSAFSRGSPQPTTGAGQQGFFSFGSTATEASTLVQSIATSPSRAQTVRPTVEPPQPPGRRPAAQQNSVLPSSPARPTQGDSSRSSSRAPGSTAPQSGRADAGRTLAVASGQSARAAALPAAARGFQFSQENGQITRSSHLRGFDTRLPTFQEEVFVSDPVFKSSDIKPGFSCEGKPYGYYADTANDCKIFHICQPVDVSSVNVFYTRYSFFCGQETRFDQSKLSCLHKEGAIPCSESSDWLFRNDNFGIQGSLEEQFQAEVQSSA